MTQTPGSGPPHPGPTPWVVTLRRWWERWVSTIACLTVSALATVALLWLRSRSQQTWLGQALDEVGMDRVVGDESTTRRLVGLLGTVSVVSIGVVVAGLVVVALLRRRVSAAVAAVVLVGGANLLTQLLKAVTERPDFGYLVVPSFPSGHATVVTSLVMAALLVTPQAVRATVSLLGTAAVTVTGGATLVASWHRPSDVLGAVLVCLAWGCLVIACWSVLRGGVPRSGPARHRLFSLLGVVVASALLLAAGVRPGGGWAGFLDAAVVLAVLGAVAVLAVATFAHLSAPMAISEVGRDLLPEPGPPAEPPRAPASPPGPGGPAPPPPPGAPGAPARPGAAAQVPGDG